MVDDHDHTLPHKTPCPAGSGYLTCLLHDSDWLLLGEVSDPSLVTMTLGAQVLTLHPEQLSYDAAATVCRTQVGRGRA